MNERTISVQRENVEQEISLVQEQQEQDIGIAPESINVSLNTDYEALQNKPQINGHELVGNKTSAELEIISDAERAAWNASLNAAVNSNECLTFWHASDVI